MLKLKCKQQHHSSSVGLFLMRRSYGLFANYQLIEDRVKLEKSSMKFNDHPDSIEELYKQIELAFKYQRLDILEQIFKQAPYLLNEELNYREYYIENFTNNPDYFIRLYELAIKYDIQDITNDCCNALSKSDLISSYPKILVKLFELAITHDLKVLYDNCCTVLSDLANNYPESYPQIYRNLLELRIQLNDENLDALLNKIENIPEEWHYFLQPS